MVERSDWAQGSLRTRNIRVTIGYKEPQPGDDENVITGNSFHLIKKRLFLKTFLSGNTLCGEFVGPGQVGGESVVTCGDK